MFIDNILNAILRPFREIYSKWMSIRSIQGGIQGDIRRVQGLGVQAQQYGQQGAQFVQGAPGQMQQGMQNAQQMVGGNQANQEKKKMSWWPWSKKTCPRCNNKLHKSWDACPFCGLAQGGGGQMQPGQFPGQPGQMQPGQFPGQPGQFQGPVPGQQPPGGPMRTLAMNVDQLNAPITSNREGSNVAWLVPLDGPQTGELFQFSGRAIVGSGDAAQIRIFDASISTQHAEVNVDGQNRFRITDLGSTNGTYVNDKRIASTDLVDGDNIRMGRTTFRFKTKN